MELLLIPFILAVMIAMIGALADGYLRPLYTRRMIIQRIWLGFRNSMLYAYGFLMLWVFINISFASAVGRSEYVLSGEWYSYLSPALALFLIATVRFWKHMPTAVHRGAKVCGNAMGVAALTSIKLGKWALIVSGGLLAVVICVFLGRAIVKGVAALPVSVAIIIGAWLIAMAIAQKERG